MSAEIPARANRQERNEGKADDEISPALQRPVTKKQHQAQNCRAPESGGRRKLQAKIIEHPLDSIPPRKNPAMGTGVLEPPEPELMKVTREDDDETCQD